MISIEGVTDWQFEPGAGPVFVGGFNVTDHGTPVSGWFWIVTSEGTNPTANASGWSNTTVTRSGKIGFLCMAGTSVVLTEGRWSIHIKYTNATGETDIVRCGRITVGSFD